jgi:hypothetical protein
MAGQQTDSALRKNRGRSEWNTEIAHTNANGIKPWLLWDCPESRLSDIIQDNYKREEVGKDECKSRTAPDKNR